ncbi:MAG: MspI family type II restriction endonuclease [Saprospiraceae bacterium]
MNNKKAVSKGNQLKSKAGVLLKDVISKKLNSLKASKIIKNYEKERNFKHKDFKYEKQFLANYIIETNDENYIIVRSSNSFRSDRAKIGFYDLEGIIKNSDLSGRIIASIYLVPDTEINRSDFISIRERIKDKTYYSPASHLITLSEFTKFLKEYQSNVLLEKEATESRNVKKERGSFFGKRGNEFEKEIVKVLSDVENLRKLRSKELDKKSVFNIILSKLLVEKNLLIEDVIFISATNSVPLLKSGGHPKTDIVLRIMISSGQIIEETISIKNTNVTQVSCHDYKVKDFIRVLNCDKTRLAKYLQLFQKYPNYKGFEEKLPDGFSIYEFTEFLKNKKVIFTEWVLRGKHDKENLVSPNLQVSNFLLVSKKGEIFFYSMEEYISILNASKKGKFGVPFSWTYPSKQEGKRIQLKLPIIVNS